LVKAPRLTRRLPAPGHNSLVAIEAITFDFWNTLMFEPQGHLRARRLDAWAGILEEAGFACEREQLHAVFDSSWERYVESWKANQQYQAVAAAEAIIEDLGFEVPVDVRDQLLEAFAVAGNEAEIRPTGSIVGCLEKLAGAGVRIGIICDVGMTASTILRSHLERHGLLGFFDHWSFSDEVGVYKPDRAIFEHALAGLGEVAPGGAAHVGDLRRTDIAGALAMGMTAVRYTGVFDDDTQPEPEGHHVIGDHADLPAALGVG
jgi:FMN phosphatase YigB (HAD superfamily)